MKGNLKEELCKYHDQHSLSESQLEKLQAMTEAFQGKKEIVEIEEVEKKVNETTLSRGYLKIFAGVAAAVFVLMAGWQVYSPQLTNTPELVKDLAYIYNKQFEPEIYASSLQGVRQGLTKLDFTVAQSSFVINENWNIIGGRYCMFQNQLGVEVYLNDKQNQKRYVWYQFLDRGAFSVPKLPYEQYSMGVKVQLWKEKGLIHGLVGVD